MTTRRSPKQIAAAKRNLAKAREAKRLKVSAHDIKWAKSSIVLRHGDAAAAKSRIVRVYPGKKIETRRRANSLRNQFEKFYKGYEPKIKASLDRHERYNARRNLAAYKRLQKMRQRGSFKVRVR